LRRKGRWRYSLNSNWTGAYASILERDPRETALSQRSNKLWWSAALVLGLIDESEFYRQPVRERIDIRHHISRALAAECSGDRAEATSWWARFSSRPLYERKCFPVPAGFLERSG
jgi:hypothetical protein